MKFALLVALRMPTRIRAAILVVAAALAACAKDPPEVVLVATEAPPPAIAAECDDRRDPKWQELPDRDVRRSEGARQHDANKDGLRTLKSYRRICREALEAQFGPINPAVASAAGPARPAQE